MKHCHRFVHVIILFYEQNHQTDNGPRVYYTVHLLGLRQSPMNEHLVGMHQQAFVRVNKKKLNFKVTIFGLEFKPAMQE